MKKKIIIIYSKTFLSSSFFPFFPLVHQSAIPPDFALVTSLNSNSSKLCNGGYESLIKSTTVGSKQVYSAFWSTIREQCLIRCEQTLSLLKVLEIHIVKRLRGYWVHVNRYSWIHIHWAHLSKLKRVIGVEGWVNSVCWTEIVNSFGESSTMGESNCMRTWKKQNKLEPSSNSIKMKAMLEKYTRECNHVCLREAMGSEHGIKFI